MYFGVLSFLIFRSNQIWIDEILAARMWQLIKSIKLSEECRPFIERIQSRCKRERYQFANGIVIRFAYSSYGVHGGSQASMYVHYDFPLLFLTFECIYFDLVSWCEFVNTFITYIDWYCSRSLCSVRDSMQCVVEA